MSRIIIFTLIAFTFCLLSFFTGYIFVKSGAINYTSELKSKEEAIDMLKERANRNSFQILFEVLKKNLLAWLIILLASVTIGIYGTIQIIIQGISLGFEFADKVKLGVEMKTLLCFTIPHGVFEILGYSIAVSLGYWAFGMFIRYLKGGKLIEEVDKKVFAYCSVCSFAIIVVSAIIESFLTPKIGLKFGF